MRVWALTKRLFKQVVRDRRSMAMLFGAPLFVLWLLSIVMTTSTTQADLDVVNVPEPFVDQLKETDANVQEVSLEVAEQHLADGTSDGYLDIRDGLLHLVLEGSDPTANRAVQQALQEAAEGLTPARSAPQVEFKHGGSDLTQMDYLAPVLIGFFIFFFVFIISGVSFLRERTGGTLERVMATPIKRYEIVLGYFLGFGVFAVLQTALVQWFALEVLDVRSVGSFGAVLVINILLATVALSLGTLLSAFARNEFQMVQFIPLVVVPQIFLSGLFDLRNMPDWLMTLSEALPLTHAAEALRAVMIRGESLGDAQVALWVLLGYCLLFLSLNILALRRYRRV